MNPFSRVVACLSFFATCLIFIGNGCSDEPSPAGPEKAKGVSVSIAPVSISLGITETRSIGAIVSAGVTNAVEWYVGGVLGGNATVGTITQTNQASYTVPDEPVLSGPVILMAVSTEDKTKLDSCQVTVTFNTVFVDKASGHDTTGVGGLNKPYQSITKAFSIAGDGQKVLVAPGVDNAQNGETFPLHIQNSVVLEGVD